MVLLEADRSTLAVGATKYKVNRLSKPPIYLGVHTFSRWPRCTSNTLKALENYCMTMLLAIPLPMAARSSSWWWRTFVSVNV